MTLRHTHSVLASLIAGAVLAQSPVIDASNNVPLYSANQEFTVRQSPTYPYTGSPGADQDYYFWDLISTSDHPYRFHEADITPTAALIPTAQFLKTDGGSDTLFYRVDPSTGLEQVGVSASLEGKLNFTDPILELKYPCSFGTTWSDATAANYVVGGIVPVTRTGTITGNADGYGQLIVSEVVYPSVLRVQLYKNITDASAPATVHRISTTWSFFTESIPYPVLKLTLDTVIVGTGTPTISTQAQWLGGEGGVGLQDITFEDVQFTAYPNPASDLITLSTERAMPTNYIAEVTSATGQLVITQRLEGELNSVDVRGLTPGVYQLRLISDRGVLGTQRLVIQ